MLGLCVKMDWGECENVCELRGEFKRMDQHKNNKNHSKSISTLQNSMETSR